MLNFRYVVLARLILTASPAIAGETVAYSYDALGRVKSVSHSGTVNDGLSVVYTHDAADNRSNVTVTGSPYNTLNRFVPVPLGGALLFISTG